MFTFVYVCLRRGASTTSLFINRLFMNCLFMFVYVCLRKSRRLNVFINHVFTENSERKLPLFFLSAKHGDAPHGTVATWVGDLRGQCRIRPGADLENPSQQKF